MLNGQTPFSIFTKIKPRLNLHLVFLVYALSMYWKHDKLDPRAVKCVFLEYSRAHKGYRCWNSLTRKYVVCDDVTFFENTPYFPLHLLLTLQFLCLFP